LDVLALRFFVEGRRRELPVKPSLGPAADCSVQRARASPRSRESWRGRTTRLRPNVRSARPAPGRAAHCAVLRANVRGRWWSYRPCAGCRLPQAKGRAVAQRFLVAKTFPSLWLCSRFGTLAGGSRPPDKIGG